MKLIQWTLFIDMLGYRDINGSIDSDASAQEFVSFMEGNQALLELTDAPHVKEQYRNNKEFNLYEHYDINNCFVSDSLIITYKPKETSEPYNEKKQLMHSANALFIIAMRLQTFIFKCYLEKGLFLRGGVSNKYCYVKDRFAVGEGLIEAYQTESSIAKYPRIVIHPAVEENSGLMKMIDFLSDNMYGGNSILQRDDVDGQLFIDHIGYAIATVNKRIPMIKAAADRNLDMYLIHLDSVKNQIQRHAEQIEKKLLELHTRIEASGNDQASRSVLESVVKKFEWLKKYHNTKVQANPWLKGRLVA
ncbi:hypothetical protein ACL9RI_12905 [Janthinobacterium sp. Mn2066]|uniref:hypothetical protein n=1 Tax=Janthinobacterium sp. Mn2066 TaxID=3395264 RepID=UPI003BDB3968